MTDTAQTVPARLFSYEFIVLTSGATLGFCNVAVLYGFATFLERLGVDPAWRGFLLGAEPLAAFCLRPVLTLLVTPQNALTLARLSLVGMGLSLYSYQFAQGVGALLAAQIVCGVSFVFLVSAITVMLVQIIPKALAGRAFGYFSLSSLIPYAIMPPLTEWLLTRVGDEGRAYAVCAWLVLPALVLFIPLGRRLGRRAMSGIGADRPSLADVRQTLALPAVRLVLLSNLTFFLCTALVYFFFKPFVLGLGMNNPGLFFTVSTVASIAVRLLAGPLYDRLPRELVLAVAFMCLAVCMAGFAATTSSRQVLVLAIVYGLCLGAIMPVLNAVMFSHSPPAMRGVTMNLMLFMMDTGYVFGPMVGGSLLAAEVGFPTLFHTAAALAVVGSLFVVPLIPEAWRAWRNPEA
ncbi:aromatic acid/H+ symport family MFS transporter [Fundidesulfovibrio butyratiphilus]